jgi:ABC-type transporter Mla subunit MlaD
MSLNLNSATARLAREMGQSEAAIAEALVAVTSLMHTAALANREVDDAPVVRTQAALLHLNRLIGSLVEARGEALRVHGQLLDIGREMGATEVPWCPDKNAMVDEDLRAA